jgi:hypothetical protein
VKGFSNLPPKENYALCVLTIGDLGFMRPSPSSPWALRCISSR